MLKLVVEIIAAREVGKEPSSVVFDLCSFNCLCFTGHFLGFKLLLVLSLLASNISRFDFS